MNDVPDFVMFLGRFHPLVVHLPIGFLFFAFILEITAKFQKKELLLAAVPSALFFGAVSAIAASILGYMLSLSGEYDGDTLDAHFWFGVATSLVATLAWLLKSGKLKLAVPNSFKMNVATLSFLVLLISITGHYGGNLTHGSNYLTEYLPFGTKKNKNLPEIANVEEARVFDYLVAPILDKKCTSCHNSGKKKGGLSLEDEVSILKGGKNGKVVIPGSSTESELTKRVHLNPEDDNFMPPEGKTPLTEAEIKIIEYWIDNGQASFEVTVAGVETSEDIETLLKVQLGLAEGEASKLTMEKAPPVSENILKDLESKGVKIREIVAETNQLDIAMLPVGKKPDAETIQDLLNELAKIKDNIVWLSLPGNDISNDHLKTISTFTNLQRLGLEKNNISDEGVKHLTALEHLKSLNLHSNKGITDSSLKTFSEMKSLKNIYTWGTSITRKGDELEKQSSI